MTLPVLERQAELTVISVNTGEEDEETIFTCTAKLYLYNKEWKEHGVGDFKINIRYETRSTPRESSAEEDANSSEKKTDADEQDVEAGQSESSIKIERKARLIMRARGTHRLILNTPIFKKMSVGTSDGKEPVGKTMFLTGLEEGKPTAYQMKVSYARPRLLSRILTSNVTDRSAKKKC